MFPTTLPLNLSWGPACSLPTCSHTTWISDDAHQCLRICRNCKYARYCCEEHQTQDWSRNHRQECDIIKETLEHNPTFAAWVLCGKNCLTLLAGGYPSSAVNEAEHLRFIADRNLLGFSSEQSKFVHMNIVAAAILTYEIYMHEMYPKSKVLNTFIDPIVGCEHRQDIWPECPNINLRTVVQWKVAYKALHDVYKYAAMQPISPRRAVELSLTRRNMEDMWEWRNSIKMLQTFFEDHATGTTRESVLHMLATAH